MCWSTPTSAASAATASPCCPTTSTSGSRARSFPTRPLSLSPKPSPPRSFPETGPWVTTRLGSRCRRRSRRLVRPGWDRPLSATALTTEPSRPTPSRPLARACWESQPPPVPLTWLPQEDDTDCTAPIPSATHCLDPRPTRWSLISPPATPPENSRTRPTNWVSCPRAPLWTPRGTRPPTRTI